jgi:hypothetical protein
VLPHIACRFCISSVKKSPNYPHLMLTGFGCTLKNVGVAAFNIVNNGGGLEEGINGCGWFFCKSLL